jgi:hypothetical protein
MGARGPVPSRSDQRRRQNKPATPVDHVLVAGEVVRPDPSEDWHQSAGAWYRAIGDSGQSRFFEPSDWQAAWFCADLMSKCMAAEVVNAQLVGQIRGLMTDLLTTESARRRVGLELERKIVQPDASMPGNVTSMTGRRKRMTDAS